MFGKGPVIETGCLRMEALYEEARATAVYFEELISLIVHERSHCMQYFCVVSVLFKLLNVDQHISTKHSRLNWYARYQ